MTFTPAQPPTGNSTQLFLTVKNKGIVSTESFVVKFYEDTNGNSLADIGELIDSARHASTLLRNDSASVSITIPSLSSGQHRYIAMLIGDSVTPYADTTLANNTVIDSVETIPAYDAALRLLSFSPSIPSVGTTVSVSTYLRNNGVNTLTSAQVNFYRDLNADQMIDPDELLDSAVFSGSLVSGDSTLLTIQDNALTMGIHHYIARIMPNLLLPQPDEKLTNNTIFGSVSISPARYAVVIHEINYDSAHGSTEWIELYNRSADTLDLKKWKIADGNSDLLNFSSTLRTITSNSYLMFPGTYVIVGKDSNQFRSKYGSPVAQAFFISFPNLNNTGDIIGIFDSLGTVIDSLLYEDNWGGGVDHSLERISADAPSYLSSNWNSSESIGTPGAENSVKPKQFDLSINAEDVSFSPEHPYKGQVFTITARILNTGLSASGNFNVEIYRKAGSDSIRLFSESHEGLAINASVQFMISDTAQSNTQVYSIIVIYSDDQKLQNNYSLKPMIVGTQPFSIVVNEINYLPSASSTEWIELYNRSLDSINLKNWRWSDEANYNSPKLITSNNYWLKPSEYVIVANDSLLFAARYPEVTAKTFFIGSSFSSLNNSGDMIVLTDSLGAVVDSLFYDDSWGGGADISLERVFADSSSFDPNNWKSSESQRLATPGKLNSQSPVDFDAAIHKNDVIFSPAHPAVGQPVIITAIIRNKGLQNIAAQITVKTFYDVNSNQNGEPSELIDSSSFIGMITGDSGVVVINWIVPAILSKQRSALAESRFILVQIEYSGDQRTENSIAVKELKVGLRNQAMLINEILYNPDTSQVEFVEIYNPGPEPVDLHNWTISDASSNKIVSPNTHYCPPQSFRVLAGDSAFFSKFPLVPDSQILIIPSMPSLNNTEDKVILRDDVGNLLDSLQYYSSWGGGHGRSLERINYSASANDPANWVSSVSSGRATPGVANSILFAQPYARNSLIINEIMYSPFTDEPEYVEIFNPADTSVNLLNWIIQIGQEKSLIIDDNYQVPPKDFIVLAQNRNFSDRFDIPTNKILLTENGLPTLSNSGNSVILRDLIGTTIDSVQYLPDWGGGNGISLERIRPMSDANAANNWGSCVFIEGGTPGAVNSNFAGTLRKKIKVKADPNPFFVDQGQETKITIELPVTQARITVKIYDNQGRLIETLLNNSLSGSHREIAWNGKDKNRSFARMGIYIIYVEAIDAASGFNKSVKQTVVLGRKL
jgi:hypothetical protein